MRIESMVCPGYLEIVDIAGWYPKDRDEPIQMGDDRTAYNAAVKRMTAFHRLMKAAATGVVINLGHLSCEESKDHMRGTFRKRDELTSALHSLWNQYLTEPAALYSVGELPRGDDVK